jgi:hypothetical protein
MSRRAGSLASVAAIVGVLVALGPVAPAHAAAANQANDPVIVPAGDVGTTAIRFREEWIADPAQATPVPVVGAFDATQVEFMGLEVKDGLSYDVTAFDGEQSGEVELTVPDTLAPGTYDTSTVTPADAGTNTGFFFHGYRGYAGYGTGSFTVLRSAYDDVGQLVSFVATYDEVLDDPLGASHVVGVVSWADTGEVPQVIQLSLVPAPLLVGGILRLEGVLLSTDGSAKFLTVQRFSHGRVTDLTGKAATPDGRITVVDRPPCAGGVAYVVTVPDSPDVLGEVAEVSVPLVLCTNNGGLFGISLNARHRLAKRR